ncbi:hypothetical protein T439DRAFT_326603 [Meredithblackwellia eburnea MCA 4105]
MSSSIIVGGCLCGKVRYELCLPEGYSPKAHTCQCTQCRKGTGSLFANWLDVPRTSFKYTVSSTLKSYKSSPLCTREFCTECGGSLTWSSEAESEKNTVEINLGSLDEAAPGDQARAELLKPHMHYYCENEIVGVTDNLNDGAARFKQGSTLGELMPY